MVENSGMDPRISARVHLVGQGSDDVTPSRLEDGFTLVELMVVLLVMAILLAIAIPAFVGVKGGA